jgi:hypothetical protein
MLELKPIALIKSTVECETTGDNADADLYLYLGGFDEKSFYVQQQRRWLERNMQC